MRTVTYGAACSLDGFIADANGAVDWLHHSKDVTEVMARYWATVDTMLMGRKTWEVAAAAAESWEEVDAGAFAGVKTYVFSRTLRQIDRPGVSLVPEDPGGFVRDLKAQPGKGICVMGGGELAVSLFDAGVIDEVGVNVQPILLGRGIPLFRDAGRRIGLELIESRVIAGGCVLSNYRVAR